ncbi:MAG: hypothetical protein IH892_21745 [Planctomycetes bacterium]|nr:hypothetical protein [Planctomycetota bacterium]
MKKRENTNRVGSGSGDRSHRRRCQCLWLIVVLLWMTLCHTTVLGRSEALRTRTTILNDLSMRLALVALGHMREAFDRTQSEAEEAQHFFDESIISKKELHESISRHAQATQRLEEAKIQLEETQLGFLDNATHITILEAKKYRDPEGRRKLYIVLHNTSNLSLAETALVQEETLERDNAVWQTPEAIRALLDIENIMVSIVDKDSISVGKPYEQIVDILPYGKTANLTFTLLTDIDHAGIRLRYLNKNITETICLENDALQTRPTVVASQFSVEGALGSDIDYPLDLEMLVTTDQNFSLTATNLPAQITYSFTEQGARVSSIRFSEEVSKHTLNFRVSIPHNLTETLIDKMIEFQAWIVTPTQLEALNHRKRQHGPDSIPVEELNLIHAARVDLVLTPRGRGRLEILIHNSYLELNPQESIGLRADLHNAGTLTLFNIRPELSVPFRWDAQIEPKQIEKLLPNEKISVTIHLEPNRDVGVGEYEAHLNARGQSGSQVIEALKKRLTVRVNAKTSLTATSILVGGLLSIMIGIIFFGGKLSRR